MRTSVLKRVGGFDPRLPHAADMELWMRLAANSDVGFVRGVDQAYYRKHQRSMSTSYGVLMGLLQRQMAYEMVLDRYGERLVDPEHLSDLVHRRLAWEALLAAARAYDRGRTRRPRLTN